MPGFPALPATRLVKWAGMLATLAMLAMLAWLGARVFWSLTTPTTVAPPVAIETDPVRAAQSIAARHLFGEAPATAPVVLKAAALPDIVLRGVIAPSQPGRPGAAVLAIAGKPAIAVRAGEEISPGAKLVRVLPGSVEIERSGLVQTLSLAERGKAQTPRAGAEAQPPSLPERGKAQLPRKEAGERGG